MLACAFALLAWMVLWPGQAAADPQLPSPTRLPVDGPARVTRGFDPPDQPWGAGHRGVDLAASVGDPVYAAAAGTVSYASKLAGRGVVVVKHGTTRTTYEPVTASVSVGDEVQAGSRIGSLERGHCSSQTTCLHWGLKQKDRYLNPMRLAPAQSDVASGPAHYRLLPASERQAVRQRAKHRRRQALRQHRQRLSQQQDPRAGADRNGGDNAGSAGSHGFRLPVDGPITSPFGRRFHPILDRWKLHDGTDFGASCGTPIRAPYDGTVTQQYFNAGYGNRLMLDHGVVDDQRVVSGFNHASSYTVGVGDAVHRGDVIGHVGQTGYATGCHLHLMVWLNGSLTNAMSWY